MVSAKTNRAVVLELNKAIQEILGDPEVEDRLKRLGFEPMRNSVADADSLMKTEIARWGEMVRTVGIVAD